jgi:cellulose biosynthesis protein BcsQ
VGRRSHDGNEQNPKLFELPAASEAIELLKAEGWTWCFIDTPPGELPRIETGIAAADVVLVPVGPSALDVEQVMRPLALVRRIVVARHL